jgi:hypothetical protein
MPKEKEKHLDPAGERTYLANLTTRMVHSTSSEHPECVPEPTDAVGFGDDLEALRAQKMIPCPLCLPT